jgi:ribose transport system substrate-binding protein
MRSQGRFRLAPIFIVLATALTVTVAAAASQGKRSAAAPGVANAKADLVKIQAGINEWTGPFTGPKAESGKTIVFVTHDMAAPVEAGIAKNLAAVAKLVGWTVKNIDGQNSLTEMSSGLNQAIALKPDAIVADAIPNALFPTLIKARKQGIPVICSATAPTPGVWTKVGCDVNIFQDYGKLGAALADWVIVHSNGKMQGVILSDKTYSIVTAKTDGIKNQFKKMGCTGCKVLEYTQVPFADAAQRLPSLTTNWVQKYGTPLYLLNPSDFFSQIEIPVLRSIKAKQGDVILTGMDGNPASYAAIRGGNGYQLMDIPLPLEYLGYQLVDNINRVINKAPISNPSTPIFVVDKTNIDKFGGKLGTFTPGNGYKKHFLELWKTGKTS